MKTQKFPARLEKSIAESFNFQQALTRLKEGKPETPRSWVYEDRDPEWILNTWVRTLRSIEDGDLSKISDWDLSKSDKFLPQGAVAPFEERQETLSEYWAHLDSPTVFRSPEWRKAKAIAVRLFGFNQSGRPRPVSEVVAKGLSEDKYNTSSGDPLFKKRKSKEAIDQAIAAVQDGTWHTYYPVLGSRASMGKVGKSARWIFMFPMAVNLYEQTFQQPLQDYIRKKRIPFFIPWEGYDAVQIELSKVTNSVLKFGCDYSKMDQHFNFHHAEECYDVIKHFFHPIYWSALHDSIIYTFHCSVVAPDYLIEGPHAMPSGSGWTNFLETVFNFILVQYFRIKYGLKLAAAMGIGDDQIWLIDTERRLGDSEVQKLAEFITSVFCSVGLDANPEKQEVSYDMISFLQRRSYSNWSPRGVKYAGVYPTIRALTSEVFPEFYHNDKAWTKNTFALRCLMIMENCSNHPLFKEFCLFIAEGNKNIPEFCLQDDAFILLTRHQSKKISNFIPTYTQAKMDEDPTKFLSLKIIREHYMNKAS